jgi:hypothetical protein
LEHFPLSTCILNFKIRINITRRQASGLSLQTTSTSNRSRTKISRSNDDTIASHFPLSKEQLPYLELQVRSIQHNSNTMIYRRSSILSFMAGLLAVATTCHAQDKKVDPAQAMRDMQIGMSGLKQAGEDPEMLAQLMRDMQVRYCYVTVTLLLSCAVLRCVSVTVVLLNIRPDRYSTSTPCRMECVGR